MRTSLIVLAVPVLLALLASCEKDGTPASGGFTAASIVFRSDSGYTYRSDTVGILDTLHVGMTADKGSDALVGFLLMVSYNNGPAIHTDSATIASTPFHFEKRIIARAQTGTEKWTFQVSEADGDRTNRSITLTVQ